MAAIFALSSRSTLPRPASISGEVFAIMGHFGAYTALAICIWWALGRVDLPPGQRILLGFAGAVLYGLTDEWHQSFVPGRTPDVRDIGVDAIGATVGVLLAPRLLARLDAVVERKGFGGE